MKAFFCLFLFSVSSITFADTRVDQVLGSCKKEFSYYLLEAKKELVKNSNWNYDNGYSTEDVKSETSVVAGKNLINVYVYFNVNGLKDKGFTFSFEPIYRNGNVCDFIDVVLIRENLF